jgi:hypothetical protein
VSEGNLKNLKDIDVSTWGKKPKKKGNKKTQSKPTEKKEKKEKKKILLEITDPFEYHAIELAISKCLNLFKAAKYDTPSSPVKSFKEKWNEIAIREKWIEKKN